MSRRTGGNSRQTKYVTFFVLGLLLGDLFFFLGKQEKHLTFHPLSWSCVLYLHSALPHYLRLPFLHLLSTCYTTHMYVHLFTYINAYMTEVISEVPQNQTNDQQ